MQTLQDALRTHGYAQALGLPLDGNYHRFDHAGSLTGWFKGRLTPSGVTVAAYGDWKKKEHFEFQGSDKPMTPEELAAAHAEIEEMKRQEEADRARVQADVSNTCERLWSDAIDRGVTPYLTKKGLTKLYGARICSDYPDTLLIPGRDVDGRIWTIQRILPAKLASGIDKIMAKGGRKQACFHLMGEIDPNGLIYICEGFATAASIHEALGPGSAVASAFDAGNLSSVGRALRDKYPSARLIFCADDDRYPSSHRQGNPGVECAQAAASDVGGEVRVPGFKNYGTRPTDFDDLRQLEGIEAVTQQLLNPPAKPTAPEKKKKFSEKLVAEWMIEVYGSRLVRQDKDLFAYDGKRWQELDSTGIDKLKNHINTLCGEQLSSKDVNSVFNTFFRYIPTLPARINLHQPARDKANFQNGTLHLSFRPKTRDELSATPGTGTHVFSLAFKQHDPQDFCTTVLPLDYKPEDELPENPALQEMFGNVWPDGDRTAKVHLYEELLGSCLVPLFPMVFFFVGVPRSGKSTLIMLMSKLVGEGNASSCDPTTWAKSFGMESMVNKLVNIDTDISVTRKLPDDLLKKVIDSRAQINRKFKSSVEARLPAIHAFGANDMPGNQEGGSGAYDRRARLLRTTTPQAGAGGGSEFSDWVWGQSPAGVLRAALRGLTRLLANGGVYSNPESSREEMKAWAKENDIVHQFIEAIEAGEVMNGADRWVIHPEATVSAGGFYNRFVQYVEEVDSGLIRRGGLISAVTFSKRIYRDLRFVSKRTNVQRLVSGVGVRGSEGGAF